MTKTNLIISAGGTGGHIFPALAVAKELVQEYNIIWVGAKLGLENQILPKHGYPLFTIAVAGVRNKGIIRKLMLPLTMLKAFWQSLIILLHTNPCMVIGFGGYATFPIGVMARLIGKPLVIHEQNAVAGLTNQLLAKIASKILIAFPGVLPSNKTVFVGNPVREEIIKLSDRQGTNLSCHTDKLRILVIGGSLGAKVLNDNVPLALAKISKHILSVVHQIGQGNIETVEELYRKYHIDAKVINFIDNVASAYANADVIICRAGALTVAEVALSGVLAIFVPYPFAVDDHQTTNAKYLVDREAAFLLPQSKLNPKVLAELLAQLTPEKCQVMAAKAKVAAIFDAKEQICYQIKQVIKK